MLNKLRDYLHEYMFGTLLLNYRRIFRQKVNLMRYDDETAIKRMYKKRTNRELNLEHPLRYAEKLQWNKLYHRDPLMTQCVDKIGVRKYLIEKGYEEFLTPVIGEYRSVDEIEWKDIPPKCIFKASHGSSMHIIKTKTMRKVPFLWRLVMNSWLKMNIYIDGREWPYKYVKRKVFAEEYISDKGKELTDYKFYCFNGNPKFCQVILNRSSKETIDFFDMHWEHQPFVGITPNIQNSKSIIEKPKNFDKMKNFARELSTGTYFCRIDFYEADDHLYFGEFTLYPGSGFGYFAPDKWNYILGDMISI